MPDSVTLVHPTQVWMCLEKTRHFEFRQVVALAGCKAEMRPWCLEQMQIVCGEGLSQKKSHISIKRLQSLWILISEDGKSLRRSFLPHLEKRIIELESLIDNEESKIKLDLLGCPCLLKIYQDELKNCVAHRNKLIRR